jgi:creatinine amidohydrolase/Fe(II)-dependent formamide hydrolase-like protein
MATDRWIRASNPLAEFVPPGRGPAVRLADLPWPDIGERAAADTVLAGESGILGDPARATAGEGRALLDHLSAALIREVAAWLRGVPT